MALATSFFYIVFKKLHELGKNLGAFDFLNQELGALPEKEIRQNIFQHIKENAKKKAIFLDSINGYTDHAHCLISLNKNQCISDTAQLIKGESSNWINKEKLTTTKFMWQDVIGQLVLVKARCRPCGNTFSIRRTTIAKYLLQKK